MMSSQASCPELKVRGVTSEQPVVMKSNGAMSAMEMALLVMRLNEACP